MAAEMSGPGVLCGVPRQPCAPYTMLYPGSDIDIQPLRALAPWETRAVFVDDLMPPEIHGRTGLTNVFDQYEQSHTDDPRPSFRVTSRSIRDMYRNHTGQQAALAELLSARLRESGFTNVRQLDRPSMSNTITIGFVHDGRRRRLHFMIGGIERLLEPSVQRGLHLCGSVSSIVHLAFGHESLPELLLSLSCSAQTRFIVPASDDQVATARIRTLVGTDRRFARLTGFVAADSFAGQAGVLELCRPANHSFIHGLDEIARRAAHSQAYTADTFDVFDAFEPQHRHHHDHSANFLMQMKLSHFRVMLGQGSIRYHDEPHRHGKTRLHANLQSLGDLARRFSKDPCWMAHLTPEGATCTWADINQQMGGAGRGPDGTTFANARTDL